jgi:hypothetical protein
MSKLRSADNEESADGCALSIVAGGKSECIYAH